MKHIHQHWLSVKEVNEKVAAFKEAVRKAKNPHDLIQTKRMLEAYMRAIEKKIFQLPMSTGSRKLIEVEHKITYKYD